LLLILELLHATREIAAHRSGELDSPDLHALLLGHRQRAIRADLHVKIILGFPALNAETNVIESHFGCEPATCFFDGVKVRL
jgi:hypothetical protein